MIDLHVQVAKSGSELNRQHGVNLQTSGVENMLERFDGYTFGRALHPDLERRWLRRRSLLVCLDLFSWELPWSAGAALLRGFEGVLDKLNAVRSLSDRLANWSLFALSSPLSLSSSSPSSPSKASMLSLLRTLSLSLKVLLLSFSFDNSCHLRLKGGDFGTGGTPPKLVSAFDRACNMHTIFQSAAPEEAGADVAVETQAAGEAAETGQDGEEEEDRCVADIDERQAAAASFGALQEGAEEPADVQGLQEEQEPYSAVCASVSSFAAPSWAARDGRQRHLQHKSSSGGLGGADDKSEDSFPLSIFSEGSSSFMFSEYLNLMSDDLLGLGAGVPAETEPTVMLSPGGAGDGVGREAGPAGAEAGLRLASGSRTLSLSFGFLLDGSSEPAGRAGPSDHFGLSVGDHRQQARPEEPE
ncbi:hypothetical protein KC363_g190 [Hortaea werneckii]|nr:hypothetical protein KC363_g190 [Hortaea werneckii]